MSGHPAFDKLIRLLKELFQPDLDFGLYRIMHGMTTDPLPMPFEAAWAFADVLDRRVADVDPLAGRQPAIQ